MPPVLDPSKSKVDGLAFLGLSLSRKSEQGHPGSATHQEAFDLNEVLDRDYKHIFSTNDDGWLVGGGEPGPPTSYKLAAKDSAHVEIMRIGTYRKDCGGVPQEEIIKVMKSGEILIPQIEALPTAVVANSDKPPELEIRFDMVPEIPDFDDKEAPLPVNWQLRFLHNQLFKKFIFPSRFCPGAFHSTILRKAGFRSEEHRDQYFAKCDAAIAKWKEQGPQPLNTIPRDMEGNPIPEQPATEKEDAENEEGDDDSSPEECHSGIWLFTDRENITQFFAPNFLPPYDTPLKRKIIMDVLKEEWDEKELSWKPCGEGSMTKQKPVPPPAADDAAEDADADADADAVDTSAVAEPPKDALLFVEEKKEDENSSIVAVVEPEKPKNVKMGLLGGCATSTTNSDDDWGGKKSMFAEKFDEMVGEMLTHANICAQVSGIASLKKNYEPEALP